jgi:outer membrane protein
MKKLLILSAFMFFAAATVSAQNYMVVNTENIFKALSAYNTAVDEIDKQAQQYQDNIDAAYEKIEQQYNTYMSQKAMLSQSEQQQREDAIINNEKKVAEYQETIFGAEGTIAKLQAEKLEPIRKRVMETISKYAKDHNFSLVLDITTNPMVIYFDPAVDKTEQIIALLK